MEGEKMSTSRSMNNNNKGDEDREDDVPLPGFRFHPTDEELVGFYLRRKIEKRPLSIDLIKQVDIYKYDPWDLPSTYIYIYTLINNFYFFTKYVSSFNFLISQL